MTDLTNKKILIIIAHQDYQDVEYGTPKGIFEGAGAKVTTASSEASPAQGKLGGTAQVDVVLQDVSAADFDAVIFVGGAGAVNYVGDPEASRIASEAIDQDKILGAICIAPTILAKAGVLQGKKATVWHASLEDDSIKQLQAGGAEFVEQDVVVDGNIITANGPGAAEEFGQKIVKALVNRD
ncbi:DJ-1/PfpI family protein [Patescibacteria group bacterium]|nr:DJ-1/PfpI family protein [Patescibacteria group bacterium]